MYRKLTAAILFGLVGASATAQGWVQTPGMFQAGGFELVTFNSFNDLVEVDSEGNFRLLIQQKSSNPSVSSSMVLFGYTPSGAMMHFPTQVSTTSAGFFPRAFDELDGYVVASMSDNSTQYLRNKTAAATQTYQIGSSVHLNSAARGPGIASLVRVPSEPPALQLQLRDASGNVTLTAGAAPYYADSSLPPVRIGAIGNRSRGVITDNGVLRILEWSNSSGLLLRNDSLAGPSNLISQAVAPDGTHYLTTTSGSDPIQSCQIVKVPVSGAPTIIFNVNTPNCSPGRHIDADNGGVVALFEEFLSPRRWVHIAPSGIPYFDVALTSTPLARYNTVKSRSLKLSDGRAALVYTGFVDQTQTDRQVIVDVYSATGVLQSSQTLPDLDSMRDVHAKSAPKGDVYVAYTETSINGLAAKVARLDF